MPADAWVVQFPVGKCSHPAERSLGRSRNLMGNSGAECGPANHEFAERVERSDTRVSPTRSHMLSQGRIDDTLLVREIARGTGVMPSAK